MEEIKEIDSIEFGVYSSDEIIKMSVSEIAVHKFSSNTHLKSSLYDPKMGAMNNNEVCQTCQKKLIDCNGHFGHIVLNIPVVHPLYYRTVLSFLKCFCIQCSRLVITEDHLHLWSISKLKGETMFNHILSKIIKIRFCMHCNTSQPKYTISTQEGIFIASYKSGDTVEKIKMTVQEIAKIFNGIMDSDIRLLGLNPLKTHPKHLILTVLPVIPPRARPFINTDNVICDDDLTVSLAEIVKANEHLKNENLSESKRIKYIQTLNFRIKTLMDNSSGKARHTNSRALKGIKERLCGKGGLIRNNLLGKRVNQSARTVIGPDPTLRMDEIAIPYEIADNLTYPERVSDYNRDYLQKLVLNDGANVVERGKVKFILKYALAGDKRDKFLLKNGDIVHRKLKDGDYILCNRQPSLHAGSMMAMKILRKPGKSIRLPLCNTSSFNADHFKN